MKILQQIVLSAAFATSMLAVSTSAMATGKEGGSVQAMIESTIHHTEAALAAANAMNADDNKETILGHIKEARQAQKDIVVGALDQARQKASAKLIAAGRDTKEGKTKEAKESLEAAIVAFNELLDQSKKTK